MPHGKHAFVGNGTISELKHAVRIVVRAKADHPFSSVAGTAKTQRKRQLSSISPLLVARFDRWRLVDGAPPDSRQRVANDSTLCGELRLIPHVLQLATATPVDAV